MKILEVFIVFKPQSTAVPPLLSEHDSRSAVPGIGLHRRANATDRDPTERFSSRHRHDPLLREKTLDEVLVWTRGVIAHTRVT